MKRDALPGVVKPATRPASVGSSSVLRNRSLALIEDWIAPVPSSPAAFDSPAGVSVASAIGRLAPELKALVIALTTFCWLAENPPPPETLAPPPPKLSATLR